MDDGRAASDAVMASSGAHQAAGNLNLRTVYEEPPPRGSLFFCLLFFWVSKRKVRFNRQKIFLSLMSRTRPKH